MSGPALHWHEDDAVLQSMELSIDPVTAWLILREGAQPKGEPESFFSILDAADPGSGIRGEEQEQPRTLQTLIAKPSVLTPMLNARIYDIGLRTRARAPRLYALPLHRQSLPETITGDADYGAGLIVLPVSGPRPLPADRIGAVRPDVIVGIIDYAINPTHARFQHVDDDGNRHSRIAHFWLQDGAHVAPAMDDDPGVPFGRELNAAAITEALTAAQGDEEAALRRLGLLHFRTGAEDRPKTELARRLSHGTHVLDLAAGRDPRDPEGMQVQIVAVGLPDAVRRETSGMTLSLFFLQALEFILMRSRGIHGTHVGKAPPVLICASLGITGGPRGGQHLIERATDALLARHDDLIGETGNARLYLPSGNSNLARGHAVSTSCDGAATLSVPWRLQPGDESTNYLEAWIKHPSGDAPDGVSLKLTPPGTLASPGTLDLTPGEARLLTLVPAGGGAAAVIGRVTLEETPEGPLRLSITLAGTDPAATGLSAAPAGAWGVQIVAPAPAEEIAAWILRDDDPVEHSGNVRQSYFDALDYVERDRCGALRATDPDPPGSAVRRAGTLNGIATTPGRDVVGGFVQPLEDASGTTPVSTAARYAGTPLPEGRALADPEHVSWAAPCDSSPVLRGVLAAGTRSGSLVAMDGTSVAAPQLVRARVRLLLDGSEADPETLSKQPGKPRPPPLGDRPIRTPLDVNRLDARAARGEPRV